MSALTLVTLAVVLYCVPHKKGYGRALALGGATPMGAALAAGTLAVPTFYAVSIGAAVAVCLALLNHGSAPAPARRRLPPGVPVLLLFLAWSTFVTVVAPELFNGMEVPVPTVNTGHLASGTLTPSNYAQIIYLALGIFVIVFLARSPHSGPELIGLAAGLATLLSLWRYLSGLTGVPFPEGVFDNSPIFVYIDTDVGGAPRFRGIMSEPSALGGSCMVTLSYMLPRAAQLSGWRRAGALFVAATALYLGIISTSGTFVVAASVVAVIAAVTFTIGFLSRRTSISTFFGVGLCATVVVGLWLLPIVADFVESTVNNKVSSSSFDERTFSNDLAYKVFFDTYGFGVGLGASRASSFFPGLLSTTGLLGTLLFVAAVAGLVVRSCRLREYRPVIWALVAVLVLKVVAGPDLSDTSGILWISLGLLSHAAGLAQTRKENAALDGAAPAVAVARGPTVPRPDTP